VQVRRLGRGLLGSKRDLPESVLQTVGLWTGCVAGALEREEYEDILKEAGFEEIVVEVTNVYDPEVVEGLVGPEELEACVGCPPRAPSCGPASRPGGPDLG
jgi:hypothetical protein